MNAPIKNKVFIASSICKLIKPYIEKNKSGEISSKLGSTNQGTGIAVVARTRRHCIRLYDIENVFNGEMTKDELKEKIKFSCEQIDKELYNNKSEKYYEDIVEELVEAYKTIKEKIGNFSVDYTKFLASIPEESKILIEGCNGIMLDNIHGLNPYTTSCSTSINSLLNGANLSPYLLDKSYIVATGYFCCLNKRPFVTEMEQEEAKKIYKNNSEVDDAEGMLRRIGWFDMPTLKKALIGHKNSELIINKLDIMKDLEEVKVCTNYILPNGEKLEYMPDDVTLLKKVKPEYKIFKGWGNIENINNYNDLPKELKEFIKFIEDETKFKIAYIGVGRRKSDLIKL